MDPWSDLSPSDRQTNRVDRAAVAQFLAVMSRQTPRTMVRQALALQVLCRRECHTHTLTPATLAEALRYLRLLLLTEP